jgi:hypothetical protein
LRPVVAGQSGLDLERSLGLEVDVLLHTLDRDDVGLDLGGRADCEGERSVSELLEELAAEAREQRTDPVERLSRGQRVREHQSDDAGVNTPSANERDDGEEGGRKDDDGAEEL